MLLIIGNGFDINLGLNTSYENYITFLRDKVEPKVIENLVHPSYLLNSEFVKTDLYKYLQKQKENKRWIDIENELKAYSLTLISTSNFAAKEAFKDSFLINEIKKEQQSIKAKEELIELVKKIEKEFEILVSGIKEYISISVSLGPNRTKHAYNYYKKLTEYLIHKYTLAPADQSFFSVLNFNYTSKYTINPIFEFVIKDYTEKNTDTIKKTNINTFSRNYHCSEVHGNLDNNVIIGIEGTSELPKEFNFLKKGLQYKYTQGVNVERMLIKNDTVHIYGLSLGETDSPYFRNFFGSYSKPEDPLKAETHIKPKNIVIFHYGKKGYEEIITMIDILTNKNVDRLRQQNNIKFIDLESYDEANDINSDYYFPFETIG
jgi:hypothetical protein